MSIFLLGGLGCARSQPTATPAPQVTPAPTATASPTPTLTPAPTAAASPTLTPTRTPGQASDTTPPVITEIRVEEPHYDTFGVFWKTDEPTIGRLEYGLSPDINLSSPWTAELRTAAGVTTIAPVIFATYSFRVRVKDAAGNETVTRVFVLTVLPMDYEDPWVYVEDLL